MCKPTYTCIYAHKTTPYTSTQNKNGDKKVEMLKMNKKKNKFPLKYMEKHLYTLLYKTNIL